MSKVNLNTKVVALAIALVSVFSINLKAQGDYLITNEGEKIIVGKDAKMGADIFYFKDKNFKEQKYRQSHIKVLFFGGRIYIRPRKHYLEEIVCYNDKYFLTNYFEIKGHGNFFYYYNIYDWSLNEVFTKGRQDFGGMWSGGKEKKLEKVDKNVKPYFGDCKSLMDKMTDNVNSDRLLCKEIYNEKCGTKDISEFLKTFLSGQTSNKK